VLIPTKIPNKNQYYFFQEFPRNKNFRKNFIEKYISDKIPKKKLFFSVTLPTKIPNKNQYYFVQEFPRNKNFLKISLKNIFPIKSQRKNYSFL
jgi:hypothetical protein